MIGTTLELASTDLIAEAVAWRHHLHRYPEIAYEEHQTADFIAKRLAEFGLKVHRGLGSTGVVGTLSRGAGRRTIGIRADMDALPIQEQSGADYASCKPGVMHACGHDGHVAVALAAARACAELPGLDGTVHFIFQPAEENEGGGRRMIEDGLFRLFPCDAIYALHNWPALPLGSCVARDGAMMAAMDLFEITLSGRGCHGAMPHEGTDCVLAGCQLVCALHTIVSRNVDPLRPAVISATTIKAGDTWNVIPESCVIRGSARWLHEDVGAILERRIGEVSVGIAQSFGCSANVHYDHRFPPTVNDPVIAASVRRMIGERVPELRLADAAPSMGSEDFAFMLKAVPGCYLWLGAGRERNNRGLHSSYYDFNDDLMPAAVALWVALVRDTLGGSGR